MLQNEFFKTVAYNAGEYEIIELAGNEKYDDNTIYKPGIYDITVRAGGAWVTTDGVTKKFVVKPVTIKKTLTITTSFIIRAYCGAESYANGNTSTVVLGENPYSGTFKVNGVGDPNIQIQTVNHIFGNAGSAGYVHTGGIVPATNYLPSAGNCLGNGAKDGYMTYSMTCSGAGSCLHIIPVGGTFGTDFLYAFQVTGAVTKGIMVGNGGGGSAFAGAASGYGSTYAGGNTPYGTGGSAGGYDGTGIGAGKAGGESVGVFFDGASWNNENTIVGDDTDGLIKITHIKI